MFSIHNNFCNILLICYSCYFEWHDTWVGVLMAFVIGRPIYYYRICTAKVEDGHNGSSYTKSGFSCSKYSFVVKNPPFR